MRHPQLALEYLVTCSQTSLEGFELARLNQISSFRKELGELQDQWIEAEVAARLARLLLEHHRAESQSSSDSPALLSNISVLQRLSCEPASTTALRATAELRESLAVSRESPLPVVGGTEETEAAPADCRSHESLMLSSTPSNRAAVAPAVKTDRPAGRSKDSTKTASTFPAALVPVAPPAERSRPPAKVRSSNLLLFVASNSRASPPGSREHRQTNAGQLSLFARGSETFAALRAFESRHSRQQPACSESPSSKSPVSQARHTGSGCRAPQSVPHSVSRPAPRPVSRKALGSSRRLASSA